MGYFGLDFDVGERDDLDLGRREEVGFLNFSGFCGVFHHYCKKEFYRVEGIEFKFYK